MNFNLFVMELENNIQHFNPEGEQKQTWTTLYAWNHHLWSTSSIPAANHTVSGTRQNSIDRLKWSSKMHQEWHGSQPQAEHPLWSLHPCSMPTTQKAEQKFPWKPHFGSSTTQAQTSLTLPSPSPFSNSSFIPVMSEWEHYSTGTWKVRMCSDIASSACVLCLSTTIMCPSISNSITWVLEVTLGLSVDVRLKLELFHKYKTEFGSQSEVK